MEGIRFNTSLTISWRLGTRLTATDYVISYSNLNTNCFSESKTIPGIAGNEIMYKLTGLKEGTQYTVTVSANLTGEVLNFVKQSSIMETLATG